MKGVFRLDFNFYLVIPLKSGGRTEKRFIGFGPFFVGLSVNGSKFVGLSVKAKHHGVGD